MCPMIQKRWGFKSEFLGIVGLRGKKTGQIDAQLENYDVIGEFFPNRRRLVINILNIFRMSLLAGAHHKLLFFAMWQTNPTMDSAILDTFQKYVA